MIQIAKTVYSIIPRREEHEAYKLVQKRVKRIQIKDLVKHKHTHIILFHFYFISNFIYFTKNTKQKFKKLYVFCHIINSNKVLQIGDMEYLIDLPVQAEFYVQSIINEPAGMDFFFTFQLSAYVSELVILMTHAF